VTVLDFKITSVEDIDEDNKKTVTVLKLKNTVYENSFANNNY
jgi:hypothetical protein